MVGYNEQICLRSLRRGILEYSKSYRHASTKAQPKLKSSSRITPLPTLSRTASKPTASRVRISPMETRKLFAAQRLYENGIRNVYTAPSHLGILSTTWLLATLLIGKAGSMALQRYDKLRDGHGLGWLQKTAVEGIGRVSMVVLTIVGAYAVMRYRNLIKSLDLVRTGNQMELRVSVRRILPFLKPKEYFIPPYYLRLPTNWKVLSEPDPHLGPINFSQQMVGVLSWPFRKMRDYFTMNGMLATNFQLDDKRIQGLLDVSGKFNGGMSALDDIATETRTWD